MKKKPVIISAAAILVLAGGAFGFNALGKNKNETELVNVAAVKLEKKDIDDSIGISGSIKGEEYPIENSQQSKCIKVNVAVGDYVKKGDVLFEFDKDSLQTQYDKLVQGYNTERDKMETEHRINERNLENAKNTNSAVISKAKQKIRDAENARDNAYNQYNNIVNEYNALVEYANGLLQHPDITDEKSETAAEYRSTVEQYINLEEKMEFLQSGLSEYDNAVTAAYDAYDEVRMSDNGSIQSAQDVLDAEQFAQYSIEQNDIDQLDEQIKKCVVKADRDGIITALNVREGAMPYGDTLCTITDVNNYFITASLSETKIYKLEEGMKASVKTVATGDEEIDGTLSEISSIADISVNMESNAKTYGIKIDITDRDKLDKVFLGMTASARIILSTTKNVYAVPYDSIISENDKYYVYLAEPSDVGYTVSKTEIEKGIETNYLTIISGAKIKDGTIVISMPETVEVGKKVNLILE